MFGVRVEGYVRLKQNIRVLLGRHRMLLEQRLHCIYLVCESKAEIGRQLFLCDRGLQADVKNPLSLPESESTCRNLSTQTGEAWNAATNCTRSHATDYQRSAALMWSAGTAELETFARGPADQKCTHFRPQCTPTNPVPCADLSRRLARTSAHATLCCVSRHQDYGHINLCRRVTLAVLVSGRNSLPR